MGREDVWQLHGHGGLNKPKLTRGECQTSNLHEVHSTQSLPQAPVEADEPEEEGDEIPKCTPKAESAILGDGFWLFGEVLSHTATPAELAAQVAIALLRIHAISAPETERDLATRNGALELVTAYVMMVLRGPDGVTRSLGEVPDSELPHDIVECRNALLRHHRLMVATCCLACGAGADSIVRVLFELDNDAGRHTVPCDRHGEPPCIWRQGRAQRGGALLFATHTCRSPAQRRATRTRGLPWMIAPPPYVRSSRT